MRRYLKNIFLFSIGLMIINIGLYFLVFKPILYKKYQKNISELKKYSMFLLSDSHGGVLDNKHLESIGIYNFSFGSDSYFDMYIKLKYLFNHNNRKICFLSKTLNVK